MRPIQRISILAIFLFFLNVDACPDYVNTKIERCVIPVVEYAKVLNQQENSTNVGRKSQFGQALQFPKLGGQVFQELCRLIRTFDHCVQTYKQVCPKHITINLIDASYGYLCNEGYQTFMASADCLMSLDQKPEVKHCHDQTLTDIENANSESTIRLETKLTRMCGALNYFAACVRQHIWNGCGVDAWHVIFRVLKDTTKTLMPSCLFSGESAKLDAEQRQQQAEESVDEEPESPYSNIIANSRTSKGRSTSPTQLAIRTSHSSQIIDEPDNVMSRSLEAQNDESNLNQEISNTGQLNDNQQPISFEIHEESTDNRLTNNQPISGHFGTWSSGTSGKRSQITFVLIFLCICHLFNRIFN